ncbi:YitT family protein [Priestia endophytica]|uniref:YitT family protein n=1 Tax=Priestia endophytica TaxID=135735 RepID=UPI00227FEC32|nr:YitT family protein [Priestia endophytica]MCY8233180.1 YitT family protein [Priestia endophytica]
MKRLFNILLACLLTGTGVIILNHSHVVTGGTAGLSLSLAYLSDAPFTILFFLINIPFYIFSFFKMGMKFTVTTICAVTLLSLITAVNPFLPSFEIPSILGAVIGGAVIGLGLSFLFINGASLGGFNIVTLYFQKRFQLNPGKVNFSLDFAVVLLSIYSIGIFKGLCSVVSIAVTSFIIGYFKRQIAASSKEQTIQPSIKMPFQHKAEA